MKRIITTVALVTVFAATSFAQNNNNSNNNSSSCAEDALQGLRNRLDSKGVQYSLTPSMSGTEMYLCLYNNPSHGKVQSSLTHYNHDRNNCSSAPMIIINNDPFAE